MKGTRSVRGAGTMVDDSSGHHDVSVVYRTEYEII